MRTLVFVGCFLAASATEASGFGWYACSVEWSQLREVIQTEEAHLESLLEGSSNAELRDYFQIEADGAVVDLCTERGVTESPVSSEFYSVESLNYALLFQRERGVESSYFERFHNPKRAIDLGTSTDQEMIHPVHFILSPDEIAAFGRELNELIREDHPPRHRRQLLHLEAVMQKATNDLWGDPETTPKSGFARELGNGERAIIFYGGD